MTGVGTHARALTFGIRARGRTNADAATPVTDRGWYNSTTSLTKNAAIAVAV
jgi:hypothetical protein